MADKRGKAIDLPRWWLDLANRASERDGRGLVVLGQVLAKKVRRAENWHHTVVLRFLRNENATQEMADAFRLVFKLPRVFHRPRSLEEAVELEAVAAKHDPVEGDLVRSDRIGQLDSYLSDSEREVEAQTAKVESRDVTRRKAGRRAGRVQRSRPSPSRS